MEVLLITKLNTSRFILRALDPLVDDFANYLSWMRNPISNRFIHSINCGVALQDLRDYVNTKNQSHDALLFGIFTIASNFHVGNVKLGPITPDKTATVGILVGEEEWRGVGVGFEVLSRIINFSFYDLKIRKIILGVHADNLAAVNLYKKLGFLEYPDPQGKPKHIKMKIDCPPYIIT